MSPSFHLPDPSHFTVGTVGPPGQRTFYLQVGPVDAGTELVSFKVEKQQVAALAEYLASLLADLPEPSGAHVPAPPLVEPVESVWPVGGIGIAVDELDDRIVLVVHELVPEPADEMEGVAELLAELAGLEDDEDDESDELDEGDGALARMRLTREQAAAFIDRAGELMSASRPPCPFCGLPTDPTGHYCPREN